MLPRSRLALALDRAGAFFLGVLMWSLHLWITRFACDARGYGDMLGLHRDFAVLIERWCQMAKPGDFSEDDRKLMLMALDLGQTSAERAAKNTRLLETVRAEYEKLAARYAALRGSLVLTK